MTKKIIDNKHESTCNILIRDFDITGIVHSIDVQYLRAANALFPAIDVQLALERRVVGVCVERSEIAA